MRTQATINLQALRHNLELAKSLAPASKIMAVIKANAYGHGEVAVAQALPDADYFGVAALSEAEHLIGAGVQTPIVLMSGFWDAAQLDAIVQHGLETFLHAPEQIALLKAHPPAKPLPLWLHFDTGMHRLGFSVLDAPDVIRQIQAIPNARIQAITTHFACADALDNPMTLQQAERLVNIARQYRFPVSMANSAALMQFSGTQADIIRPGLMLYGACPIMRASANALHLKAVMTLQSTIIAIRSVPKGDAVGYGATWQAKRNSRIATVAIGYGDGYPQCANGAPVLVRNQKAHVVGRVSMDSLAIDVTDIPEAAVNDTVTLWGDGLPIEAVAEATHMSVYSLLTSVSPRVVRVNSQAKKMLAGLELA